MKKIIIAALLAACMAIPALAQSSASESETPIWNHGDNVSEMVYHSAPVYSITMTRDAYVVFYQTQGMKVDTAVIPKDWAKRGENKKLYFRNKAPGLDTYITVYYRNGNFDHVVLTANPDIRDPVWHIAPSYTKVDVSGIETLEVDF
ncbi:MAG: hypothetical protein J5930_10865 [Treponema sp.]|nr:hypothetical protein [Treponema sp.]